MLQSVRYDRSKNSNNLIDRAVIDFGEISVSATEPDRLLNINYKIGVKDHHNVANGSKHYAGVGLQAGPEVRVHKIRLIYKSYYGEN